MRSVVTLREVAAGEELLVDYGYDLIRWLYCDDDYDYDYDYDYDDDDDYDDDYVYGQQRIFHWTNLHTIVLT